MRGQDNESLIKKIKEGRCKELILRKDIVIRAGTTLTPAPTNTRRSGAGHFSTTIGLSRDSSGNLTYSLDPSNTEDIEQLISRWFLVI
jgi:hypothetical protein